MVRDYLVTKYNVGASCTVPFLVASLAALTSCADAGVGPTLPEAPPGAEPVERNDVAGADSGAAPDPENAPISTSAANLDALTRDGGVTRPNIVLVLADDLGYGDVSAFAPTAIRTPNLDRLAREGAKLTDFYAAPVCTPSRAQLLTGRQPIRSGLTRVLNQRAVGGLQAGEVTVAEALKGGGYTTACVGKWHLGHLAPHLPTRHGFDSYFGLPYSNDMSPTSLPLMRNEDVIERPARQETLTRRYTEEAVAFMGRAKADGKPFFLYLPHTMPHIPLHASEAFAGRSARGKYGDVVEELDWSVGELLAAIKRLGIDRETLVIFTSDNGPWLSQGVNGGNAGPLRAGKATVYEGGVRVPFLARWPGRIPAGRVTMRPAASYDLLPTLLSMAGVSLPTAKTLDGRNIAGLLDGTGQRGEPSDPAAKDFFFFQSAELSAMRTNRWKLHFARVNGSIEPTELYDLQVDIGESRNVAAQQGQLVREMTARARSFSASVRRDATPEQQ